MALWLPRRAALCLQEALRAARQRNSSSPAAGAMFWGATVGNSTDWDGWQVRLDGGRSGLGAACRGAAGCLVALPLGPGAPDALPAPFP